MKIELTDIEFALLVDLVYAGNWVINSWRVSYDEIKPYSDMKQRIFSLYVKEKIKDAPKSESEKDVSMDTDEELSYRLDHYFKSYSDREILHRFAEILAEYQYDDEHKKEQIEAKDKYLAEIDRNYLKNVAIRVVSAKISD